MYTASCKVMLLPLAVLICSGCANDSDSKDETPPLTLVDVDYVLDGGSIYFNFSESNGAQKFCVFVIYPQSPIIARYFPQVDVTAPIVVRAPSSDDIEDGSSISHASLGELLERLSASDQSKLDQTTQGAIKYFERIHETGDVPVHWGYDAVFSLIKHGRGTDCFVESIAFPTPSGY